MEVYDFAGWLAEVFPIILGALSYPVINGVKPCASLAAQPDPPTFISSPYLLIPPPQKLTTICARSRGLHKWHVRHTIAQFSRRRCHLLE